MFTRKDHRAAHDAISAAYSPRAQFTAENAQFSIALNVGEPKQTSWKSAQLFVQPRFFRLPLSQRNTCTMDNRLAEVSTSL